MRPIDRGSNPITGDFPDYKKAYPQLVSRIGDYCSYCERRVKAGLEVEHIQPKSLPCYTHLIGSWENFLLACKNCNTTKGKKDVALSEQYIPDRDNTFVPFEYSDDGRIHLTRALTPDQVRLAANTLSLTGLDREYYEILDANGALIAVNRQSHRKQIWGIAQRSLARLKANPIVALKEQIVDTACAEGHFSIWMKVYEHDMDMRHRLILGFKGTSGDCFDLLTQAISARPNNGLPHAGKI